MIGRPVFFAVVITLVAGCDRQPADRQPGNKDAKSDQQGAAADPLATERDLKALQGKWELVSLKRDWVEASEPPCHYEFKGETMTVSPRDKRSSYYTVMLDASKSPKQMDIIATWEDGKVTKAEAIYELEGDTFRWCHVNGKRPPVFLSAQNPGGTLNVIRRARDQ
jgi:uncharacterized protein (TIGR03067 family)